MKPKKPTYKLEKEPNIFVELSQFIGLGIIFGILFMVCTILAGV